MEAVEHWKYGARSWLGRVLAGVELSAIGVVDVDRQSYYAKRRRWFIAPLIFAGNRYLKLLGAHVRVLADPAWHRWESEVYRRVHDIELRRDAHGRLLIPEWSGISLAVLLESGAHSEAEKLGAIGLAAEALCRLHGVVVRWPDGQDRPLSHGDATVENVVIDRARGTASWFDFDTIHDARMDDGWRHADDLRALVYSAAARLPAGIFPELASAIVQRYVKPRPLEALAEATADRRACPNCFHLAQAPLAYRDHRLLEKALLDAL